MKFHVPPDRRWSATRVAKVLEAIGFHSRPARDTVCVRLPSIDIPSFPFFWRKIRYNPEIILVYHPAKFFYNGEIQYDTGKITFDREIEKIASALEEIGWVLLPDEDLQLELETLLEYTETESEIRDRFAEMERLQSAILAWLANQDFENALKTRNQQDTIRDDIDKLLADHYRAAPP